MSRRVLDVDQGLDGTGRAGSYGCAISVIALELSITSCLPVGGFVSSLLVQHQIRIKRQE